MTVAVAVTNKKSEFFLDVENEMKKGKHVKEDTLTLDSVVVDCIVVVDHVVDRVVAPGSGRRRPRPRCQPGRRLPSPLC